MGGARAAISLLLLTVGCAGPVPELWPPGEGAATYTIIVSVDTWHAMIAFPQRSAEETSQSSVLNTQSSRFQSSALSPQSSNTSQSSVPSTQSYLSEEWGYAEQAWYLEGRQGISGVLRALFWPSSGVVEVAQYNRVWSERTPQPPADQFTFRLTEQGYQRLRRYLESTLAGTKPIWTAAGSMFYRATRSYHVFHQCHQYSAQALREAGLPISPFWALSRGLFASQLRRAQGIASETGQAASLDPIPR